MQRMAIPLGSLESRSNPLRPPGRASESVNVDLDRTNEPARRNGLIRRFDTQLSGPVRMLFSYAGIGGRFYRYVDGGGLIYVSGQPWPPWGDWDLWGTGAYEGLPGWMQDPLPDWPPIDYPSWWPPAWDWDDTWDSSAENWPPYYSGGGNPNSSAGGQGIGRGVSASDSVDPDIEDPDDLDTTLVLSAVQSGIDDVFLSWTYPEWFTEEWVPMHNVEIWRKTDGYPAYIGDGTQVYSGRDSSYLDTAVSLKDPAYYSAWFSILGVGIFGIFMAVVLFSDDFNRANGALTTPWSPYSPIRSGDYIRIVSNAIQRSASNKSGGAVLFETQITGDCVLEIDAFPDTDLTDDFETCYCLVGLRYQGTDTDIPGRRWRVVAAEVKRYLNTSLIQQWEISALHFDLATRSRTVGQSVSEAVVEDLTGFNTLRFEFTGRTEVTATYRNHSVTLDLGTDPFPGVAMTPFIMIWDDSTAEHSVMDNFARLLPEPQQ